MDKISFPFRSSTHLVLLHVIAESGSWEKHGLDVEYNKHISSSDAHDAVLKGEVEFVGGNHVSTYGRRARGDNWVYLGQTVNRVSHRLVVRADSEITGLCDLREKKVGTRGSHPSLNHWLLLKKRGLDADRDEVEIVKQRSLDADHDHDHGEGEAIHGHLKKGATAAVDPEMSGTPLWQLVKEGKIDAAILTPPACFFAEANGLRTIDIEPLPMIWFTTLSSSLEFVAKHPDIVERFIKGTIEGIHYFKTRPDQTIRIIQETYTNEGKMTYEQAAMTYHNLAPMLEPKLMPTIAAISNVYEEAIRQDKDALKVNPMELWDLHYLRHLDDIGFVRSLYGRPV